MTAPLHGIILRMTAAIAISLANCANGADILIHEGPTVSVPGLATIRPSGAQGGEPPDLVYIKRFYTDEKNTGVKAVDPQTKAPRVITAVRAIELALASMEKDYEKNIPTVTKLESFPPMTSGVESIAYFLITMNINGSEEHRVVLMNGTVIEPRLKRIE